MLRDNYHLPDVTQWQNIVMLITLFGPALFLDSETTEILELLKSFDTKKTIHFYIYLLSINKYDMEMLRNEWNKELESPVLSRQCENVLTSIIRVTMDLILQLIKQKIVFRIYWTLFHL